MSDYIRDFADVEVTPYTPSPEEAALAAEVNQGSPGDWEGHPTIDDDEAEKERIWVEDTAKAEEYAEWVREQAEEEARKRRIIERSGVPAGPEVGDDLESEVG